MILNENKKISEASSDNVYTVKWKRRGVERSTSGTLKELINYFGYTLEVGKSWEHERGNKKINMNPKTIDQLVDNLNKAKSNAAANGAPDTFYYK